MGGKRGNNEGSILSHRSDGRWMARMTLDDGARKTFYGKTRQEVSRLLASALRDRDAGLPIVGKTDSRELPCAMAQRHQTHDSATFLGRP